MCLGLQQGRCRAEDDLRQPSQVPLRLWHRTTDLPPSTGHTVFLTLSSWHCFPDTVFLAQSSWPIFDTIFLITFSWHHLPEIIFLRPSSWPSSSPISDLYPSTLICASSAVHWGITFRVSQGFKESVNPKFAPYYSKMSALGINLSCCFSFSEVSTAAVNFNGLSLTIAHNWSVKYGLFFWNSIFSC